MDIIDYWLNLAQLSAQTPRKGEAFEQLEAMGYFTPDDEPETWWLDASTEMRLLYL